MAIKRFGLVLPALALALAASVCSAAHAELAVPADPIAASFQRLLDHPPSGTAPAAPDGAADPLRSTVSAVLWEAQPPSFHLPAACARVLARTKAGN